MPFTTENVLQWVQRYAQEIHENSQYLTQLDSAIGDADHGANMDRGFKAVSTKLAGMENADIGTILKTVGTTLVSTVGGASGPLYGTAFLRAGMATSGKSELETADILSMLEAAAEGVRTRGKAQVGEKTMLDALYPALEAGKQAQTENASMSEVLQRMADGAEEGMKKTIPMLATKGRASYLGERSVDHQDPGATSSWLLLKSLAEVSKE
ncbi:MAG: dihydroxyacetone kinase subunit L [Ktedonobacteraceae bacterium]|nr:dihydroxyacetone kinase subunit L [Ktedonobacteraceae bacterium]